MADESMNEKSRKKRWLVLVIVIIALLSLLYIYKRDKWEKIEVPPIRHQESGGEYKMEEIKPMFGRGDMVPDEDELAEPGESAAKEGVRLYVKEKYEEAKEFLERAAEEGNADAKALLGKMYVMGRGVGQDVEKGLEYLEDAAERGSSYAMSELGMLYVEGRHGVEKAADKGLALIHRSIESGKYYGYLAMARLHAAGESVELSIEKAIEYIKQAGERGYKYAMEEIEKLKEKL